MEDEKDLELQLQALKRYLEQQGKEEPVDSDMITEDEPAEYSPPTRKARYDDMVDEMDNEEIKKRKWKILSNME